MRTILVAMIALAVACGGDDDGMEPRECMQGPGGGEDVSLDGWCCGDSAHFMKDPAARLCSNEHVNQFTGKVVTGTQIAVINGQGQLGVEWFDSATDGRFACGWRPCQ